MQDPRPASGRLAPLLQEPHRGAAPFPPWGVLSIVFGHNECQPLAVAAMTGALLEQKALRDSEALPDADLVRGLRDILGAKLVAYIGSVKETKAVRAWADGETKPSKEVMRRLRNAYHVAALLEGRDSRGVVQAWF